MTVEDFGKLLGYVVGALVTLAAAAGAGYGAWVAAYKVWVGVRQTWRMDTVAILEKHTSRLHAELELNKVHLAQKQEAIDELYEMNFDCEFHESETYNWIMRATERMARESEKLRSLGIEPEPPLEPPARRPVAEKSKKHAAYLRRRAKHNTEMAAMVADKLLSEAPDDTEPKTY